VPVCLLRDLLGIALKSGLMRDDDDGPPMPMAAAPRQAAAMQRPVALAQQGQQHITAAQWAPQQRLSPMQRPQQLGAQQPGAARAPAPAAALMDRGESAPEQSADSGQSSGTGANGAMSKAIRRVLSA
jgi:hypothetical protein